MTSEHHSSSPPRVLHLFSNHKWTGPAEPALNLTLALRESGIAVDFACSPLIGSGVNKLVETARDRGIEPILAFRLGKHHHPIHNPLDVYRLRRFLRRRPYDLIHCHMDNDHRIAAAAARGMGIPIIRSSYYGEGIPSTYGISRCIRTADMIIQPSKTAADNDKSRWGLTDERHSVIPNAVDVTRFDPSRGLPDIRSWLHIPRDAFVLGIVARMQKHRHYGDLWEAAARLVKEFPCLHVLIVGRGTRQGKVAHEPVLTNGLSHAVHFGGHVDGDNYVGMLKAFDAKIFLVPGSDGTCRAVREAMAMGKPCIVADRGMLREIVDDGFNGVVCDGSPDSICEATAMLIRDKASRRGMGQAAREKAHASYSLEAQAKAVTALYERVLRSANTLKRATD